MIEGIPFSRRTFAASILAAIERFPPHKCGG
jgi:hypothetical protein